MNRRLFAAGMAAMVPTVAQGQAATPANDGDPLVVLTGYIEAVIRDGEVSAIPDYFDSEALDLNAVTWDQADIRNGVGRDSAPVSSEITIAFGDDRQAIALARIWSNQNYARDVFVAVDVEAGKIVAYRWMVDGVY